MLFSCKISNSVLTFLDRHGEDLGELYENPDWPAELLRDPSYWIEADKMESLLEHLTTKYGHAVSDSALCTEVAKRAFELRGWGALDSVLRLVHAPKDLFAQPSRLLSYFISPAPPVGDVRREAEGIRFEVPLDASEYPRVVEYLRCAFEGLPAYLGRAPAQARWDGSEISIRWSDDQENLFTGTATGERRSLNPGLVRNVLESLEQSQQRLEEAKLDLSVKNEELRSLRAQLRQAQTRASKPRAPEQAALWTDERDASVAADESAEFSVRAPTLDRRAAATFADALSEALDQSYRLRDYVARAHQLVTILVGQNRATPAVQEAMKRMNWTSVQANAPAASAALAQLLRDLRNELEPQREPADDASAGQLARPHDQRRDQRPDQRHERGLHV